VLSAASSLTDYTHSSSRFTPRAVALELPQFLFGAIEQI
jgi:hypothetical protein